MREYPGSLHNHTDYSNFRLRDAIDKTEDLLDYAVELGHKVIAITEHETIANALRVEKYREKKHPDLKIILGNEIYLCRNGLTLENFDKTKDKYYHFILLAKDARGHEQIREISTRAWKRSFVERGMRRVPTYYQDLIEIIKADPGHVIASTACLGSFLDIKLLEDRETGQHYEDIKHWLQNVQNIFGKGNFYLEMQPSHSQEQIYVNKKIVQLSEELNIPYIITTDTHYLKKEDAPIHKAFLNSQDGDREVESFYASTYMMDTPELESYFPYFTPEQLHKAYDTIMEIADKCQDYSLKKPLKIPSLKWRKPKIRNINYEPYFELIPYLKTFKESEFPGDKLIVDLIIEKIESDKRLQNKAFYDEINSNLESTWISSNVNKAHWSAYFLNLQNIIDVCWKAGSLVGPGRGSGVGFALLYALDIIQINCLWETTATKSWRFLNPERVSVLD